MRVFSIRPMCLPCLRAASAGRCGEEKIKLIPFRILNTGYQIKFVERKFMAATNQIDKQIANYLGLLNSEQKKAILTVAKTFVENKETDDYWKDESFIKELCCYVQIVYNILLPLFG